MVFATSACLVSMSPSSKGTQRDSVFFGGASHQWPRRVVVLGVPGWWNETNPDFSHGIRHDLCRMLSTGCLGVSSLFWFWLLQTIVCVPMLSWLSLPNWILRRRKTRGQGMGGYGSMSGLKAVIQRQARWSCNKRRCQLSSCFSCAFNHSWWTLTSNLKFWNNNVCVLCLHHGLFAPNQVVTHPDFEEALHTILTSPSEAVLKLGSHIYVVAWDGCCHGSTSLSVDSCFQHHPPPSQGLTAREDSIEHQRWLRCSGQSWQ